MISSYRQTSTSCEPCISDRVSALFHVSALIADGNPAAGHQFSSASASSAEEGIWLLRGNTGWENAPDCWSDILALSPIRYLPRSP